MSAAEVIEAIEKLPAAEQARVVSYVQAHLCSAEAGPRTPDDPAGPKAVRYMDRDRAKEIADEVFRMNAELFRKLAQ